MQDAMTIWNSICHSQWFKQTSIVFIFRAFLTIRLLNRLLLQQILFLSKDDLLRKKYHIPTSRTSSLTLTVRRMTFAPVVITLGNVLQDLRRKQIRRSVRYTFTSPPPQTLPCFE
ncbi:hypothetical protein BC835DRAFT_917871 [Cytidiella melzeri]|nr:hypothetical protein BC835DRAFT_917871 [Cytidiella melzeri]